MSITFMSFTLPPSMQFNAACAARPAAPRIGALGSAVFAGLALVLIAGSAARACEDEAHGGKDAAPVFRAGCDNAKSGDGCKPDAPVVPDPGMSGSKPSSPDTINTEPKESAPPPEPEEADDGPAFGEATDMEAEMDRLLGEIKGTQRD